MNRRRFPIVAAAGCGLLLLLLLVAIPAAFFIAFRSGGPSGPGLLLETSQARQEEAVAVPTFTPARAVEPPQEVGELPQQVQPDLPISSELLTGLYQQLNPGVVSISVNVERGHLVGASAGSGFLIDEQGHIVTNNHVVAGARAVVITFFEGTQARAEVVGSDVGSDLAVVRVESLPEGVHPLALGDSEQVTVGEWVIAIGNPFALNNSMTAGIVSAIGRTIPTEATPFSIPQVIQTDAAINPGNSGGPLLNLAGEVIGVNAQIATSGTGANAGVGFAIPSNIVRRVAPVLISEGEFTWPWLGVEGTNVGLLIQQANELESPRGAYIDRVVPGGPAEAAGLRGSESSAEIDNLAVPVGGDVVVEADGSPIESFDALLNTIAARSPGQTMNLTIVREGRREQVAVTLAPRPEEFNP